MKWWDALCRLAGVLADAGSSELVGGAGALVGLMLLAVLANLLVRPVVAVFRTHAGSALRDRSERAGVPRHRDPDASGRTRPRGPTGAAAVA